MICLCRIVDSTVQLIYLSINIYIFLLASCGEPTGPILGYGAINGLPVNGSFPDGTKAYFECELGSGSSIIHHPSTCQSNGEWTQTSGCEGSGFIGSQRKFSKVNGNNVIVIPSYFINICNGLL